MAACSAVGQARVRPWPAAGRWMPLDAAILAACAVCAADGSGQRGVRQQTASAPARTAAGLLVLQPAGSTTVGQQ
ncbi:hypothetical protein BS78_02G095900 [Paspalum vaginatum]|nr:hypothetical protein BS78_02G095900 [Paspalum vaginatum]